MPAKDHLIEAIREYNGSARRDWLSQFDDDSLRRYLATKGDALVTRRRYSRSCKTP